MSKATTTDPIRARLRDEADAAMPAFDASLHARTMQRLRDADPIASDAGADPLRIGPRRLGVGPSFAMAAAACVAVALGGAWAWTGLRSGPTERPPVAVARPAHEPTNLDAFFAPIGAPRLDPAVPALLDAPQEHYEALGDDARRVGRFFADQFDMLDGAVAPAQRRGANS